MNLGVFTINIQIDPTFTFTLLKTSTPPHLPQKNNKENMFEPLKESFKYMIEFIINTLIIKNENA
jgi:hypothetical protein